MKHVAIAGAVMRNSLSERRRCEKSLQMLDEVYSLFEYRHRK